MTPAALLQRLQAAAVEGSLPPLALALARQWHRLDPDAPASLLAAAALLVVLEQRGHTALPLAETGPDHEGLAEWRALLPVDADAARVAWARSPLLQWMDADPSAAEGGSAPLVLQGGRLALRRLWAAEQRAAAALRARAQAVGEPAGPEDLQPLLDRLFGARTDPEGSPAQRQAAERALHGRLLIVTGGPGTGKTWTAARLLLLLQALQPPADAAAPLRVALAAPTGKAAARLRQSIESALQDLPVRGDDGLSRRLAAASRHIGAELALQPPRTLHAWLGARPGTRRFIHDATRPLAVDLMLVDEASMIDLEMLAALLDALPGGARLVLLGDRDQLSSVEAGSVMTDLCAGPLAACTVTLQAGRRFEGPIAALAAAVNQGDAAAAQTLLGGSGPSLQQWVQPRLEALLDLAQGAQGHGPFLRALAARPTAAADFEPWALQLLGAFERFRVLTALRAGPFGAQALNALLSERLGGPRHEAPGGWWEGRPVMVTRNDAALQLFNGDIGLTLRPPDGGPWRVWFREGAALRSVAAARLSAVETAWAMTVHKSQGSEFGHVALVLPTEDAPVLTRELVYTGLTRAREQFTLVSPEPALFTRALGRRTRRFSGLAEALRGA